MFCCFQFGMDMEVYMTKPDRTYKKMTLRELLPLGFGPSSLEEERIGKDAQMNGLVQGPVKSPVHAGLEQ